MFSPNKLQIRAAIYSRTAVRSKNSNRYQLMTLKRCAAKHEMSIVGVYVDNGFSGTSFQRPGLNRLISDTKNNLIDVLLIMSPDRLARNSLMLAGLKEEFKNNNVKVFFNEPQLNPEEKIFESIEGIFNKYERLKRFDHIMRGRLYNENQRKA